MQDDGAVPPVPPVPPRPVDPRIAEILPGLPRVAALDALLRDVDALRLGLETDLSLAAGAVEAGAPEVAADVVEEDLRALRAFEARALAHLAALEEADDRAARAADPEVAPVVALAPRRARRLSRLLPAAPFAAAAALVGVLGLSQTTSPQPEPQTVPAAVESWAELERLSAAGAPPEALERAAEDFHADIAVLLAVAEDDPAAARQALDLLRRGQVALESVQDPSALAAVLTQSRLLTARLLATLPPVAPTVPVVELPGSPALPVPLPTTPPTPATLRPVPPPTTLPTAEPQRSPSARPVPPSRPSSTSEAPARPSPSPSPSAQPRLFPPASPPPDLDGDARTGASLPLPRPGQ